MVQADKYVKYCRDANIPVLVREQKIIDKITHNGWFYPIEFIQRMRAGGLPITENMRKILDWLPDKYDGAELAKDKERILRAEVALMNRRNDSMRGVKYLK